MERSSPCYLVGMQGVQLAKQIEDLDGKFEKQINLDLNTKREAVSGTVPPGVTIKMHTLLGSRLKILTTSQQKSTEIFTLQRALNKATGLSPEIYLPNYAACISNQLPHDSCKTTDGHHRRYGSPWSPTNHQPSDGSLWRDMAFPRIRLYRKRTMPILRTEK